MGWHNTTDWLGRTRSMSTETLAREIALNAKKVVTPGVLEERERLTKEMDRRLASSRRILAAGMSTV